MIRPLLAATLLIALAACGSREPLQPRPGASLPAKPAAAARQPTTEELLTAPPAMRPERQDDSLRRSEERQDDPFDLPPTG